MSRPQGTGIIELHDAKQEERGFGCMKLMAFLTRDGMTEWDEWHGAHQKAASGQCPYTGECSIYKRTINSFERIKE